MNASVPRLLPMPSDVGAGRLPGWPSDRLVHRACPICMADRPGPICRRPDDLLVARCEDCRMVYLPDIPDAETLASFYRNYSAFKGTGVVPQSRLRRLITANPLSLVRQLASVDPFTQILLRTGGLAGRQVCELGCAFGYHLFAARREGAVVTGIELDEEAVGYLKHRGIAVGSSLPKTETFDVICAFQLIEHLADPGRFAAEVARALKPDGRLLMALPNGGEADKAGPAWVGFRVDLEHLNYFGVGTLARLLQRHGLYLEHFWEYSQPTIPRSKGGASDLGALRRYYNARVPWALNQPHYAGGSFELCVLARKVSGE